MTLVAHKILDLFRGRGDKRMRISLPNKKTTTKDLIVLCNAIEEAQKFDFGQITNEPIPDSPGAWKMPQITHEEWGFWHEGLIPLPHPVCWFEFEIGEFRSCLLVIQIENKWTVQRIEWNEKRGIIEWHDILAEADQMGASHYLLSPGHMDVQVHGDPDLIDELARLTGKGLMLFGNNFCLAVYLALMINSRTTEVRADVPPPKLNKARSKEGKTPLFEHRVVTIVPKRFLREPQDLQGTHASPRLHWRMSHKRHFAHQTPRAKWMGSEEWNGRVGWWVTVIPRQLIGRRDLGAVTHDYEVMR